jgi:hypothetical protein
LPDGGAYSPGDYLRSAESRVQRARPSLVSIGTGGVYLRLHQAAGDRQPTYFLDGRKVETVNGVTWPAIPKDARSEMAHVGSDHVPVLLVREGSAVVRARQSGSGYVFDALTAGLPEPTRFGLAQVQSIAYSGNRSGIHVHTQDMVGESAEGRLFPFRATGEVLDTPIRVPVQLDADPTPRKCSDNEKRSTPRVVVPYQPGTRHPITITDAVEPLRLLMTDRAVMYGTPQSAFVAAFDAEPVDLSGAIEGARITSAIIALDDLENAWAFRAIEQEGGGRVETRNMKCHFDPNLEVPPEAQLVPGARVRRRR